MVKFKDIANLYMGCEGIAETMAKFDTKLVAYNPTNDMRNGITLDQIEQWKFKPILRPLSSMTEEEDVQVANFCFGREDFIVTGRGMGYEESGHQIHKSVKCIKMEVFCDHPMIQSYVPAALLQIDNEDDWNPIIISRFSDAGKELEDDVIEQPFQLTAYLLSKHFDIFGLIKNGEAIDKTKL
jgi:hypothetical protein